MLLIFPTEVGFDKQRLPWFTLALLTLNLLCFLTFQLDDEQEQQQVMNYYQQSGLFTLELPFFQQYLQTPEGLKTYREVSIVEKEGPERLYFMVFDQNFRLYLAQQLRPAGSNDEEQNLAPVTHYNSPDESESDNSGATSSRLQEDPAQLQQWYWLSQELEHKKQQITYYAHGLRPGSIQWDTLLTHLFLHADLDHLIGNMLFLLLFGIGVERLFGSIGFGIIYFSAGILGALVFSAIDGKSYQPLIGASGAISGLMGAYTAYYGSQPIRFFAWFGFYFNQFRWPALWVLVFWLLKELFSQLMDNENQVAYWAHFGGLLGGALIGRWLRPRNGSEADAQPKSVQDRELQLYQQALQQIRQLETQQARQTLETLLKQSPRHLNALKNLYNLDKLNPRHANYRNTVDRILNYPLQDDDSDEFILSVAQDALPHHLTVSDLSIDAFFSLLHRWLRNDRVETSEPYIKQAKKVFAENARLPRLLFEWSIALMRRNKLRAAAIELNYLANYYGETSYGKAARAELRKMKSG
jgi:membrane associated rhomboid family serine protease